VSAAGGTTRGLARWSGAAAGGGNAELAGGGEQRADGWWRRAWSAVRDVGTGGRRSG
jgi:hypothetical protein